ncbi:co-chaperone GroES [Duganella sp. FT94W]|uniref:Co-chaperonin GroES n=1 Tax=Duganella lactea TaxID=2692173 RepID=A0ABW9V5H8_9BURK|nr:co-chaperone GroES [Duganella lactea]
MKLRPLYDRVIVKRIEQQRQTASGIVIPDSATEKPEQGEVLAVGHGRALPDGSLRALAVNVGDSVLFGKYAGQTVKLDGQEVLVMREEDLLGVIESPQATLKAAA